MSNKGTGKYQDKVILITGGARGLGRLIALDFAKEGAKISIADLRESDMKSTALEIEAKGVEVFTMTIDLSTKEGCQKMVQETENHFGPIDILINNAGVVFCMNIIDNTDEQIRKTIDINLMAQVWATRAVLPAMMERNSGLIISVASGAGKVGSPGVGIYCSSKFGLVGFFDSLRHELRMSGSEVRVVVLCPGFMDTKMFVGTKTTMFTKVKDAQETSTALMKGLDKGKEEIFSPKILKLVAFCRGFYSPRRMEKAMETAGLHEAFYSSKTID